MKKYYCWRCEREIPMLEEHEWTRIAPLLTNHIDKVKFIRQRQSCDLKTARQIAGQEACDLYFEITGYRETCFEAIWHHRLSDFGPECPRCGRLFRTPKASFCVNCGLKREELNEKDADRNIG